MPRFMVERLFDQRNDDMLARAHARGSELLQTDSRALRWLHSHLVASDHNGFVRTFCVYDAPDIERVRRHVTTTGNAEILNVYEIAHDVYPEDEGEPDATRTRLPS